MTKKNQKLKWHNEKRKVKDLIPYEDNPRSLSEDQKRELEKSLKKFDLVEIPAINTDNKIVAGHQRIATLHDLGRDEEEIDVRVPNRTLTPEEFKEYLLRSNKNTGDWNWDLLKKFNLEMLMDVGFNDDDLNYLWDDVTELDDDQFNVKKELAQIKKPIVKPGEIWALGKHRLMCSDSTLEADVGTLMGKELADTIYCDPPYNIGLDYSKGISTEGKYGPVSRKKAGDKFPDLKYKGFKVNDRKKIDQYRIFLKATMENALKFSKPNCHIFYWCDESLIWLVQNLYEELGVANRRVCLWVKNNFNMTPQVAFNKVYEPCVYGTRGKPYLNTHYVNLNEILNKEIESGNQVLDEILEIINIWLVKREPAQEYLHPTQKPIKLNEKPIKRCTRPGDIVLDLFGGSGGQLIAAEQLGRKAYLMERDPIFASVIIKRYESFTNKKAKRI